MSDEHTHFYILHVPRKLYWLQRIKILNSCI